MSAPAPGPGAAVLPVAGPPPDAAARARRRRSVTTRIVLSYLVLTALAAVVAGWSVTALRRASAEAQVLRTGYFPLVLALRDLVSDQDRWNAQLNHVTSAPHPAEQRVFFDAATGGGRSRAFARMRAAVHRSLVDSEDAATAELGRELMSESLQIEEAAQGDRVFIDELFAALDRKDATQAEQKRVELVTRGVRLKRRLGELEARVERHVDALILAAQVRERVALRLLIALGVAALLVGVGTAFYARRVLRPLREVTARAQVVARGDFTPQEVVTSADEIGELAETFERMVAAIALTSERLVAAERLAAIGEMAAHVTHEIRNPLSSIALNVELLEEELSALPDGEARALLRAVKAEVERLTALSQQYLSFARGQRLALELEDPADVVREACTFLRPELERAGVTLEVELPDHLPAVPLDEAGLKQALHNLLRNAREALPRGGSVRVALAPLAGGGVELVVEDDGPGVPDAIRTQLFEPFFTTKGHGTGLGLAVTRQIVEAHGGSIVCEPRQPHGARFRLALPTPPP